MLTKALLLGLSTGPFCLCYCLPVLFPLMCGGMSAGRAVGAVTRPDGTDGASPLGARLRLLGEFSLGRLVAYLGFGALAGWLGGRVEHPLLARVSGGGLVILALLLIAYGLVTSFPKLSLCSRLGRFLPTRHLPLGLGILTGLNVCPPFLMAASYVFTMGRVFDGVAFFGIYFLVTTLWLIPVLVLGAAAKVEQVRWVAQLSALVAGLLFLWLGLGMLTGGRV